MKVKKKNVKVKELKKRENSEKRGEVEKERVRSAVVLYYRRVVQREGGKRFRIIRWTEGKGLRNKPPSHVSHGAPPTNYTLLPHRQTSKKETMTPIFTPKSLSQNFGNSIAIVYALVCLAASDKSQTDCDHFFPWCDICFLVTTEAAG